MMKLPIGPLLGYAQRLAMFGQMCLLNTKGEGIRIGVEDHERLRSDACGFVACCQTMELVVAEGLAKDFISQFEGAVNVDGRIVFGAFQVMALLDALQALTLSLKHEAETKLAIVLPPRKAAMFESTEPHFGAQVSRRFPSATGEVDEAAKRLALGRSTACVFHLMRTLEIALNAVRLSLSLPTSGGPSWAAVLGPIERDITARGRVWKHHAFYEDVHGRLDIIRRAWRNSTMHVEKVYTEADAEVLFEATKGLMQKVATRMNEKGKPRDL